MSKQNSIIFNYYEDESFSSKSHNRSKIIVKHDNNKPHSRAISNKQLKEPNRLDKKVENLVKKQELWKEREQVWGKERKNLEKALKNVKFYLGI